ncbi:MAG: holo-ACP synthase [Myxococcota bacterium]
MIIGVGIDITDVERIKRLIEKRGARFLDRVYTTGERKHSLASGKGSAMRFGARFAAKEAAIKALGGVKDTAYNEYEVVTTKSGKPELRLKGRAAEVARNMGVKSIHLSFSHLPKYAVAVVVLEG